MRTKRAVEYCGIHRQLRQAGFAANSNRAAAGGSWLDIREYFRRQHDWRALRKAARKHAGEARPRSGAAEIRKPRRRRSAQRARRTRQPAGRSKELYSARKAALEEKLRRTGYGQRGAM